MSYLATTIFLVAFYGVACAALGICIGAAIAARKNKQTGAEFIIGPITKRIK